MEERSNNILFWVFKRSWLECAITCDWLYRDDHLATASTEIIYEMHMNLWISFDVISFDSVAGYYTKLSPILVIHVVCTPVCTL